MPTKIRFVAFVLACAAGLGSTLFSSLFQPKGFSEAEARAKIGKRVKLIANAHSANPKVINSGVVAYAQIDHGERVLVIDWDEKLPGWNHRIVWAGRKAYQESILEE
jgi:hypothetical protein